MTESTESEKHTIDLRQFPGVMENLPAVSILRKARNRTACSMRMSRWYDCLTAATLRTSAAIRREWRSISSRWTTVRASSGTSCMSWRKRRRASAMSAAISSRARAASAMRMSRDAVSRRRRTGRSTIAQYRKSISRAGCRGRPRYPRSRHRAPR